MSKLHPVLAIGVALALSGVWAVSAAAAPISLSTDVLNEGNSGGMNYDNNYNNNGTDSTVEIVKGIAPNGAASVVVQYTQNAGNTINFAPWVSAGNWAGNLGSNKHGRSGVGPNTNLWVQGDGETSANNSPGLGAHANWFVTFDLADIRTVFLGGNTTNDLVLTGSFGPHGAIGSDGLNDGVIQGLVFLDGVRIDSMPQVRKNPDPGDASVPFSLYLPSSSRWLTIGIFTGNDSDPNMTTQWDDGVYKNLNLDFAPEPSALAMLLGVGGIGLLGCLWRRRRS